MTGFFVGGNHPALSSNTTTFLMLTSKEMVVPYGEGTLCAGYLASFLRSIVKYVELIDSTYAVLSCTSTYTCTIF